MQFESKIVVKTLLESGVDEVSPTVNLASKHGMFPLWKVLLGSTPASLTSGHSKLACFWTGRLSIQKSTGSVEPLHVHSIALGLTRLTSVALCSDDTLHSCAPPSITDGVPDRVTYPADHTGVFYSWPDSRRSSTRSHHDIFGKT